MWIIFIVSFLIILLVAMFLVWLGNKLYLRIKKDNLKFEKEYVNNEGEF